MKDKNLTKIIGNTLIAISLFGFIFIFYPVFQIYLFPPKIQNDLPDRGTFITIPKISAQAPVTENVNPFDETQYMKALKFSVAHAKGTSLPPQSGTVYLFAHSSGPPWEITRFNTIFLRLNELQKRDIIEIKRNGRTFRYNVFDKKEVLPQDVSYLTKSATNQLIVQTCTPIGTDWKRLLIFAKLEE